MLNAVVSGDFAISNINGKEAASVTGIIFSREFTPMLFVKPLITGKIISVVAVFEVNSMSIDINPVNVSFNSLRDNVLAPERMLPV